MSSNNDPNASEKKHVRDTLDSLKKVRRDLKREIVEFWKNSTGREGHAGYSQRDVEKALEWAHDQYTDRLETPAAIRFRRYVKLDRAVAVLSARNSDLNYGVFDPEGVLDA